LVVEKSLASLPEVTTLQASGVAHEITGGATQFGLDTRRRGTRVPPRVSVLETMRFSVPWIVLLWAR
jgi:hypothetical protein